MAKKSTKTTIPVSTHDSGSDNSDNDVLSSDNVKTQPKKAVVNKKVKSTKAKVESDDESQSSDNDKKTNTKIQAKIKTIDDDSEEIDVVSDHESESESESEDNQDKKSKEKKLKESFSELSNKLDILQLNIKTSDKEISEIEKTLKSKEKIRNDFERHRNALLKLLAKTHADEVIKARKEKPKRKGNVNGGFCKEQPVPDVLVKFLELKEGETCLARHQVMSKLSNKFAQMGLKKGQLTTLDEKVVKELGLPSSNINRVIEFGKFQTFLKGFYPTKEEKNTVSVC